MTLSTVTFHGAAADPGDLSVELRFTITNSAGEHHGTTTISEGLNRVRVTTVVDGSCIVSHKLDPNERENDFDVVAAELLAVFYLRAAQPSAAITMPVPGDDVDGIGAIVNTWAVGGRGEWG